MRRSGRLLTAALALAVVLLLVWPTLRRVRRERAIEPVAAWVGIERGGSGRAEVGPSTLAADEPFTLHAVLEARQGEERLFFTEARSVRIGGREIGGESVRPWRGDLEARVLWFTVEPRAPVVRSAPDGPELHYQANFRADWPHAWRVPGRLDPYRRRLMAADRELAGRFGSQRFQVRIELFGPRSDIQPEHRVVSAGPDELLAAPTGFPGAVVTLAGVLAPASRVFGLPQVIGDLDGDGARLATRWHDEGLAFTLPLLLQEMADAAGGKWSDLAWRTVDLADGPAWAGTGVAPGDPVRVGGRVAILFRDDGVPGRLDEGDLCFDYLEGPTVARLADVFTSGGLVEWAAWAPGTAP